MSDEDCHPSTAITAARHAVQEIITSQVVLKDRRGRDRLIVEHVEALGPNIVRSVVGFIYSHAADEVAAEVVTDRFYFLLSRIGRLTGLLADVSGVDEFEVVHTLASIDYKYSEDPEEECLPEVAEQFERAMRAAQTCLVAHYFVRRGSVPWGIQDSLDLEDMCAVVEMLGTVLLDLVMAFDDEHHQLVVKLLLDDVETILRSMARSERIPVSELVSRYFVRLAQRDLT